MAEGKSIGIDLGTTNTVMFEMHTTPQVILNHESEQLTPSVVAMKYGKKTGNTLLVGKRAQEYALYAGKNYIYSAKRLMGRCYDDSDVQTMRKNVGYDILPSPHGNEDMVRVKLGDKEYEAKEIASEILKKMKTDAEYRLNSEVDSAVITVPAYFNERQKHATREAGLLAGLRVKRIIDEPSAAAIAYGIDQNDGEDRMVLVFDLGGGTFDVSILLMVGGTFQQMANEGDMWLGGDDFDALIMNWVIEQIEDDEGLSGLRENQEFLQELRQKTNSAKVMLSSCESADIIINSLKDESGMPVPIEYEITQSEFNQLIDQQVEKSIEVVNNALRTAELENDDIDVVLMVGGSSIIPRFQERIEKEFGKERVMRNIDPMTCVAQGAAILAKNLSRNAVWCVCGEENSLDDLKCRKCNHDLTVAREKVKEQEPPEGPVIDHIGGITAKPYGIEVTGDRFVELIPKGTEYPTPEPFTDRFKTASIDQQIIKIQLREGFSETASENELMGTIWFTGLPKGLPEGTELELSIALDSDMIAMVDCRIRSMDWSKKMVLQHGGWINKHLSEGMRLQNELKFAEQESDKVLEKIDALLKAVDNNDEEEAKKQINELKKVQKENKPQEIEWRQQLEIYLSYLEPSFSVATVLLNQNDPSVRAMIMWIEHAKIAMRDSDEVNGNRLNDEFNDILQNVPAVASFYWGAILSNFEQLDQILRNRLAQAQADVIACLRENNNNRFEEAWADFQKRLEEAFKSLDPGPNGSLDPKIVKVGYTLQK